jgi:hypothetical protein
MTWRAVSISPYKGDLRSFLRWGAAHLGYSTLAAVEQAPPTAELEPIRDDYVQTDEVGRCRLTQFDPGLTALAFSS